MNNSTFEASINLNDCPACGANQTNCRAEVAPYRAFSCARCFTAFARPLPTQAELRAAYQSFDAGQLSRDEFQVYTERAEIMLSSALRDFRHESGARNRFLDYGCGGAHFVAAARNLGFDAMGVDIDETSVEAGRQRGLNLETIDVFETSSSAQYDVIWMFHVIEHLLAPEPVLAKLRLRLAPGGRLIVATPDQNSFPSKLKILLRNFGIKKGDYGFVQPPVHLLGFTALGLERIGSRAGFKPLSITSVSAIDSRWFPVGERYWRKLRVQYLIYLLGTWFSSGGHLLAVYENPVETL